MTNLLVALLLLGFIQGVAEFLPISSSGHLVLFQSLSFLRESTGIISEKSGLFINVMLHLATLIAIIIYLRSDIIEILKGCLNSYHNKNFQ